MEEYRISRVCKGARISRFDAGSSEIVKGIQGRGLDLDEREPA
jgi:hypothetical protein